MNRRLFLKSIAAFSTAGLATATYGLIIEPGIRLNTVAYALTPPGWTPGLKLRAVVIADPHVVNPWFPLARWQQVIATAQALEPDIVFMLGDYVSGIHFRTGKVDVADTAKIAATLKAPLGVFSINGNHDWWGDHEAQRLRHGPPQAERAFEDAGIPVLSNKAVKLSKDGMGFWVSGTDSMIAFVNRTGLEEQDTFEGRDRLAIALAQVTDQDPIIHLAHEPDLFARMPERISLALSGHTHGGQVRILGHAPWIPSMYGRKYMYGHIVENGRHLIVSGGLGCSTLPVRFGSPPEINLLELG